MNGVMMPLASAGSNQVGANDTCTPQVSCPAGPPARARPGAPATRPSALRASKSRRRTPSALRSTTEQPCLFDVIVPPSRVMPEAPTPPRLRVLDRDVLERRRVREARYLSER